MNVFNYLAIFVLVSSTLGPLAHATPDDDSEQAREEQEEYGEGRTRIPADMAARAGITTAVAGPGLIQRIITAYGPVTYSPEQVSHLRARFPGEITKVYARLGDSVKADDPLAQIESNESLRSYTLRAPIAGRIIDRRANVGETTEDAVLFAIASFNPLWAELKLFPNQLQGITSGQKVLLTTETLRHNTQLQHLLPGNDGKPFVTARAEIANSDGRWLPGMFATGYIALEEVEVSLVVDNRALQSFEGETVVFVQEGDAYEARPVKLGRSDLERTEVLAGLRADEQYVVENSFLIKADIKKSEVADDD